MTQHIDAASLVTSEVAEAYERDGAVCIRGLFSEEQIEELTQRIEENLKNPSPRAKVASQPDDPGWFF